MCRLRSYPTTEPGATIVPKFLAALVKGTLERCTYMSCMPLAVGLQRRSLLW